jgi:hypothetical protein
MVAVKILVQLMLLFVVLKGSDGQQNNASRTDNQRCVGFQLEIQVGQCYLNVFQYTIISVLQYSGTVTVLFMCRHRDTVVHSQILFEWLLYCLCFVTRIHLYLA